jgi:ankyrin repeat protein
MYTTMLSFIHLQVARILIDSGLHPDWCAANTANAMCSGNAPLSYCRTPQAVHLLLDAGADVKHLSIMGLNCLHIAGGNGAPVSVLCAMIANGADPTLVSYYIYH